MVIGSKAFKLTLAALVAPLAISTLCLGIAAGADKFIAANPDVSGTSADVKVLKEKADKLQLLVNSHESQITMAGEREKKIFSLLEKLSGDVQNVDKNVGILTQRVQDQNDRITDLSNRQR